MSDRKGNWIQTYTGKKFYPLDPRPEDIDIADIAHALSLQCRYGGHCGTFYSVAEHSILVAQAVPRKDALWGLLHDASEAYLVDVPRPIKGELGNYYEIEANLMRVICDVFDLPHDMPASVADVDQRIVLNERAKLYEYAADLWGVEELEPLENCFVRGLEWRSAKEKFVDAFDTLTGNLSVL